MTGLGERHHNGPDTDLSTHIDDVISHIEMEGLQSVTLVGWSYGGMVIAGVTARIPDKIKSLIYLDAYVPEDGKALVDYEPANLRAKVDVFMNEHKPIPPFPQEAFGVTDPSLIEFATPRLTVQPWRTFYEPCTRLCCHKAFPPPLYIVPGIGPYSLSSLRNSKVIRVFEQPSSTRTISVCLARRRRASKYSQISHKNAC